MKNISLYAAALLVAGIGLTGCEDDKVTFIPPTNYVLDAPEGMDGLVKFGLTGSNVDNQLLVNTTNPYNVNTTVDFQVQVARSEDDFKTWDNLVAQQIGSGNDNGEYNFTNSEGLPYVSTVPAIYLTPSFTVAGADFCDAINEVYGFETEEQCQAQPVQVAYRVHSWIPGVNSSSIFSNVITLPQVQSYIPIRDPRRLYLIGQPQGWNIDSGDMYVQENDPGSNIYTGTFTIQAGQFQFRFYSELGNWDEFSIGSQNEDNPVNITFTDDVYEGEVVVYDPSADILGKGSWQYSDWIGGIVDVTVDLNSNTIKMVAHEGEVGPVVPVGSVLYIVGTPQGWNINSDALSIPKVADNVYSGTVEIPAASELTDGVCTFRFYSALGDWDNNSYGSQVEDSPIEITLNNDTYSGKVVSGKGSWNITNWDGGYLKIDVNLNDMTVVMTKTDEAPVTYANIWLRGGMNGWGTETAYQFITTDKDNVWMLKDVTIEAGVEFKVADADWSAINYGGTPDTVTTINVGTETTLTYNGGNLSLGENFKGNVILTKNGDDYSVLFQAN